MSQITKIEAQSKKANRCNLFLDGKFYSGIEKFTVMKYRLKVGMEIEQSEIDNIIFDSEKETVFNYAVEYTCRYLSTQKQLTNKLYEKGYHKPLVEYVINKCKEYGYIDDLKYAQSYIFQNREIKGKIRLEQELLKKGISKQVVEEALKDFKEESGCLKLARKKAKDKDLDNPKEYASLIRYLQYRGYEFEDIKSAVDLIKRDREND